jgi:hypothetical protein
MSRPAMCVLDIAPDSAIVLASALYLPAALRIFDPSGIGHWPPLR